jgi:hypothetical protein
MSFSDLLDIAKDAAPTIAGMATTVATGGNPAAGAVVSAIFERIIGKKPKSGQDFEDMATEILGNPEKLQAFRLQMRQAELEELRIRTLDIQDARKLMTVSKGAVWISILVVCGFFTSIILAMTQAIPEGSENLAYLLIGTLASGFSSVLGYWIGSSSGSKEKNQMLAVYAEAAKKDQADRRKAGESW